MNTITNIEEKTAKNGKPFWVVSFAEAIQGKTSGSAWSEDALGGANVGDVVDVKYTIKGEYMNIDKLEVKVTGQSKGSNSFAPAVKCWTAQSACELAGEINKGLKEHGVEDEEHTTRNTILIKLMR